MPTVSIMMPAYNAENFISQALDSILLQDYPRFQIVVCDDASTDGTADIIRTYQKKYPDKIVAIFNQQNLGVTANCNKALEHCTGEYVSLFAGDDLMLPGKLSRQIELMESDPECVLCYHPVEIFDSDSGKTFFVTNQYRREDVYSTEDLLLKGGIPGGCSIMVRRNAIPEKGYDERLKTVSDWLFFLEISLKGRLRKVDEVLGRYRKHDGGASRLTYSLLAESLYALDLFEQKGSVNSELSLLIRQAKARYLAGEVFRQMPNDPETALKLARDALVFQKGLKYFVLYLVSWINCFAPGGRFMISKLAVRFKYLLKRIVG